MPNTVGGYSGITQDTNPVFNSIEPIQSFRSVTNQAGVSSVLQNRRNTVLNPPFGVSSSGESTTSNVAPAGNSLQADGEPLGLTIQSSNWFAWASIAAVVLYFLDRFDIF